jgi:hypothetical protein
LLNLGRSLLFQLQLGIIGPQSPLVKMAHKAMAYIPLEPLNAVVGSLKVSNHHIHLLIASINVTIQQPSQASSIEHLSLGL